MNLKTSDPLFSAATLQRLVANFSRRTAPPRKLIASSSRMSASDLISLGKHLLDHGPVKTHPTSRRIRVLFNQTFIVDTTSALHVWEHHRYPNYYIPTNSLKPSTITHKLPIAPGADLYTLTVSGISTNRVLAFSEGALAGLVRLEFGSMQQWFEEDAPIYVHPKDPFKRIDILASSRPIEVRLPGTATTLASSNFSQHLLETSLPTRFYLPYTSVNVGILRNSESRSKCPYKGDAEYFDVVVEGKVYKDLVWYYRTTTVECAAVAGMLCFYNERVDIVLDGVVLERPRTGF